MSTLWLILDLLLAGLTLLLGVLALYARTLHRRVVFFIAFGLLMALVWARLQAPDLALAEAAIGAGMTGALLLAALGDSSRNGATLSAPTPRPQAPNSNNDRRCRPGLVAQVYSRPFTIVIFTLLTLLFAAVVVSLFPHSSAPLEALVRENMPLTGVDHPVTAVLLNFRGYDTLLELAVLLSVTLSITALGDARPRPTHAGLLAEGLTAALVPMLTVVAGYLLWVGAHAPGGAFQAGAVLAAAFVVIRLSGTTRLPAMPLWSVRGLLVAGVGPFLLIGLAMMANGGQLLQLPPTVAGTLILIIETGATLSIGCMLAVAYLGGLPSNRNRVSPISSHRHKPNADPKSCGQEAQ